MNLAASRETKRFFDRAHRRAMNTGLPLSRAIEIETQRAASRTPRFHTGGLIQAHKKDVDARFLSDNGPLDARNAVLPRPEHEAVLPISEAPSPIPEGDHADGGIVVDGVNFGEPDQIVPYRENAAFEVSGLEDSETAADPTKAEDEAAFADDVAQEVAAKQKNIGRPVSWTQMGKEYRGTIAHVIPPNVNPRTMGVEAGAKPKKGEAAKTRDHISYVVKSDETGALAWPMRSSLTVLDAE